ncbi:DUF825 domain-containing protein, partial [Mycobacterium tuberculosis]|nr:DUF825 domain-containing protein [Mycobacterium tuberculosis]
SRCLVAATHRRILCFGTSIRCPGRLAFGSNMLWCSFPAYGVKSIRSKNKYWNLIDLISIIPNPINRIAFSRNTRHLSPPSNAIYSFRRKNHGSRAA